MKRRPAASTPAVLPAKPTRSATAAPKANTPRLADPALQEYEMVPIGKLTPHPDNPRVGDVPAIVDSIARNGFYGAIVVLFREACTLVDRKIAAGRVPVSAVERNKRVLAAMEQMRQGKQPDGTAKPTKVQFNREQLAEGRDDDE